MTEQQQAERLVRLRWACRRTLQALDQPLGKFLQDCFQTLEMGEQFAFERLLKSKDQEILDWLIGNRQPRDTGMCAIIERVRQHHNNTTGG
ncbi:MAG: hypothetical protein BWK73_08335 [Thiothrix lacustris]|uniref:FAD assembly factor SdhE n=1 Tax=Thiothrix lacustris TaxID=525917 RepID=A0A1Y1QWG1_9GAMM|nr:MAG: hypothetical protein BWK73_08335 [Thiothrix lacustris]